MSKFSKTYIVTGASNGLGFQTVKALAQDPEAVIVMAGHNEINLLRSQESLQECAKAKLVTAYLDLADLNSVRKFVRHIQQSGLPSLKGLICNAGISLSTAKRRSADGFELTFAVNHLGHFLLTLLLIDRLESPARIIIVSDREHKANWGLGHSPNAQFISSELLAHPEFKSDQSQFDIFAGAQAYANSKLCNLLFAYELSRRLTIAMERKLRGRITVNAYNPGILPDTELNRSTKGLLTFLRKTIIPIFKKKTTYRSSAEKSGQDLAWLATSTEVETITNSYFVGRQIERSSIESRYLNRACDLWNTSIQLSKFEVLENDILGDQNVIPLYKCPAIEEEPRKVGAD